MEIPLLMGAVWYQPDHASDIHPSGQAQEHLPIPVRVRECELSPAAARHWVFACAQNIFVRFAPAAGLY